MVPVFFFIITLDTKVLMKHDGVMIPRAIGEID